MSQYIKATNFTAKDALPAGNSSKVVKGSELDTEFTAIASAISSKADSNSPTFTGTPLAPTASAGTSNTQIATTAFVAAERTATATLTNKTLTSPTINTPSIVGGSVTGITDLAVADGGTGASTAANARTNLDVPSRTGSGASGDWGINITGSAATATTATNLTNSTGSAPVFGVRAWAVFDGTRDTTGAVSTANTNRLIRGSGNIASVLRVSAGVYTITFTTAMPDANYSVLLTYGASVSDGSSWQGANVAGGTTAPTASSFRTVWWSGGQATPRTEVDANYCYVQVIA